MEKSVVEGQPFRIGLFLIAVSWFVYVLYDNILSVYNRHTTLPLVREDIAATIGLGFAVAASSLAVLTILFYVIKRDLSKPETTMSVRMVLFLQGVFFVFGFVPSLFVEGIPGSFHFSNIKVFEVSLPAIADGIALPVVLAGLFLALNPNKSARGTIKWGLIVGTAYLFAFWFSNAGNWIGTVLSKGVSYIVDYPLNMLSFILTTVGLLLLALYAAYFSKKTIGKEALTSSDLNRVGAILTATGTYLTFLLVLYFLFGAVGGWGAWYAWLLGHGYLDLWGITFPFVGLPLLLYANNASQTEFTTRGPLHLLDRKQLNVFLFVIEGLGIAFYIILSSAYYWVIPSTKVLTGEPVFKIPITIFGLLYFISVIIIILLLIVEKQKK